MLNIKKISSNDKNFSEILQKYIFQRKTSTSEIRNTVQSIIEEVKKNGDKAIINFSKKFDNYHVNSVQELEISKDDIVSSLEKINDEEINALKFAKKRIETFCKKQKLKSWSYTSDDIRLGEKITPINKVGLYVPGGSAVYPSSVLMNAVPAVVAGVNEIIMVVPSPNGKVNNLVLAAAHIAGVDRVFQIGGAQAIAALAYGTETIPKVDKIVGPGNQYVAQAKKELYGEVGIDNFAGPSEILVIADSSANISWLAADLFAQAEHDEMAQSILISPDEQLLKNLEEYMAEKILNSKRKEIIQASMNNFGILINSKDLDDAIKISNDLAPEHLQLSFKDSDKYLDKINNAGAIFIGEYSPEVFGDYCVGTNHVLPTVGTAKFSSPLGVYDFQKRSNIIQCSKKSAISLSKYSAILANSEGLFSHKDSALLRNSKGEEE